MLALAHAEMMQPADARKAHQAAVAWRLRGSEHVRAAALAGLTAPSPLTALVGLVSPPPGPRLARLDTQTAQELTALFAEVELVPVKMALTCQARRLHAAAARHYSEAFAGQPKLADDLEAGHRYNAACNGALAGTGIGLDADSLDERQRAHLRRQALAWLRADLALWAKFVANGTPQQRETAAARLLHWQRDRDLVDVRHAAAVAALPADERAAWDELWAAVELLLRKRARQVP